jgi:type IV secretion system protein VirB1
MDVMALAQQCAPTVHPRTMAAIVKVESSQNPYAIGVVGGYLERQPKALDEAVATAKALQSAGYNFSVGVGQVNRYNLPKYGLTVEQAFDPCSNIRVASQIFKECFDRAYPQTREEQSALRAALSCYYSGNFQTGFKPDFTGQPSYVEKVVSAAGASTATEPIRVIRTPSKDSKPPQAPKASNVGTEQSVFKLDDADRSVFVY